MVPVILSAALILGPGVLSPASPGVLERVQATRLRYGYGLSEPAPAGAVLLAVEDCALLGRRGHALVAGVGWVDVAVVDCEADVHIGQMRARGLLADVNDARLGHRRAMVWLRGGPKWLQ